MSFILDPIIDIIDDVADVVLKPIEWIGDAVADVGDWAVEEIVEPVVGAVGDVVEAVLDDPVKAIAQVAAVATQQYWALPLIEGADVAIEGGDIGDVLEATAIAYVAGEVGSYTGNYTGSAAAKAGANATAATIIGAGTGSAASAIVTGQDPVQAFLTGGIQAGVSAGLGYIDSEISDTGGTVAAGSGGMGPGGGGGTIGSGGTIDGAGFLDQYPTVKNIISDSLTAALSGQDVTGATVMNAVIKGKVTKETVKGFIDTDNSLTDGQIALLTTSVQNVANATFSGADASDTLLATINAYGTEELNKVIDKNVKNTIDKVTGDYQKAEGQANKIDSLNTEYRKDVQIYNQFVDYLQGRIETRDGIKSEVDALQAELESKSGAEDSVYQEVLDRYNAKVIEFNNYSAEVDTYYTDMYEPSQKSRKENIDAKYAEIEAEAEIYQGFKNELVSSSDQLDDVMVEVDNATQKAYVRAMTGDEFNVEEYKNVNGLSDLSDDDARFHWLTEGKDNNLPVNAVQYKTEFDNAVTSSIQGTLEAAGLSITDLTPAQIKSLREQTEKYGNGDLQSVRDIQNGSALLGQTLRDTLAKNATSAGVDSKTQAELVADYPILEGVDLKTLSDDDFDALPKNVKDKLIDVTTKSQTKQEIIKPADVSDADILSGNAKVNTNAEGLLEWGNIDVVVPTPKWSSKYGQAVTETERYNGSFYEKTITGFKGDKLYDVSGYVETSDTTGGVPVLYGYTNYFDVNDPDKLNKNGSLTASGVRYVDSGGYLDLSHLKETNAGSYLDTLSDMTPEAVQETVQAGVAGLQEQYEFAKNVATYLANTETGKSIANSDFGKNTAGVVLAAGGELLDSMNNLVLIAGINPESTPLGKTAKNLVAMSGDMKTEEYKAAAAEIQETIGKANFDKDGKLLTNPDGTPLSTFAKAWNTVKAIGGAAMANPGTFASEYIAKELLQEIPILLASGGTANVVKAGLQQAGKEFAQKMGQRAALGTAGVLDVSESFGGTAGGAYDDAYATALKSGMSDVEAQEYALDKAITAGTIAAVTTVTTMGIGGNDFEKAIFNGKRGKNFSEAFNVVAKEAAQEAVEEGLPQAYLESQLYQLDPTRDVVGNVVSNSVLGALSGGTVAGSIYGGAATGDVVSNAMIMFNPEVRKVVQNEAGLDAAGVTQQLNNLGVSDNAIQSNILNQVFDTDYTSTGEAEQAAATYITENNVPYQFTKDEITDFTGANADADIAALVDSFVDPKYLDVQEVIAAAEAEGITLTEQQAAAYVGQKDEAQGATDAIADLTSPVTKADLLQGAVNPLDPSAIKDIVDTALADLPTSASPEDVSTAINTAISGLENVSSADVGTAINDALADMNNLSTTDVQNIVDSSISGLENISTTDVENIIDAAIANLPASASPEDVSTAINTAISGLENISTTDVDTAINSALSDMNNLSTTDVQNIVDSAVGDLSETTTAFAEQVSTLETDLTTLINQNAGDVDAALEQLAGDLGTTEDALLSEIGTTKEALETSFTEQVSTLETDLTTLINQNAGDVDTALEQLANNLGTTEDALLSEIGTTRETLTNQFTEQISTLETDLTSLINQNAGDVDAALEQLASDLGTTEDALLTEIGTTRETLSDQFTEGLSTLETDLTALINQNAGDVDVALEQLANDLGTTEDALLAEIGTTRETLTNQFTEQVSTLETDLTTLINQNAGDVDAALEQLSSDLGTTEEALLAEIGTNRETLTDLSGQLGDAQTALGDQIGDVEAALGINIQAIADLIGKPATEVTDVDIDFVADLIAQQEALSDPSTFQFTDEQLGYDVTGDGIVDINDQNLLNDALRGQDVAFAPESQFESATGIFAQLDAQNQAQMDVQAQIQAQLDAQTQAQTDAQLQIAQQVEDEAKKTRRLSNEKDLQELILQDASRVTQVRTPPVAQIGPAYDFRSIFRDSGQDAFYSSPYAEGGVVNTNEELLRLIGGK